MNEVMGTPTTEDTDYSYIVKSLMKPTDVIQLLKDPRQDFTCTGHTRSVEGLQGHCGCKGDVGGM